MKRSMPGVCKHMARGASTDYVHDSRGSRWLLILVQSQRAELVARVVSGLPRGQGRGSEEGLKRLASVNVDICGANKSWGNLQGALCTCAGPWFLL